MIPIQLEQVTKKFGDNVVVNKANLTVQEGEIFGLIGANGAGKTTTMRMVLGLINPDEGSIRWHGQGYSPEVRRILGYLPEERGLYPKVKVKEQIIYFAKLKGCSHKQADQSLKHWLEKFGIPEYYNKRVEELSKGNQQKIQFIAAVVHNPKIIILDEVFSGLDPVNVELMKDTIHSLRSEGKSILFSSHRMDHVEELCENICIYKKGNTVLQGNLKEIKRSFPKEKVLLETAQAVTGLEAINGIRSVNQNQTGYEIRIENMEAAQQILKKASEQTQIYRFQILEPSLNEIFIQKVGGLNE